MVADQCKCCYRGYYYIKYGITTGTQNLDVAFVLVLDAMCIIVERLARVLVCAISP